METRKAQFEKALWEIERVVDPLSAIIGIWENTNNKRKLKLEGQSCYGFYQTLKSVESNLLKRSKELRALIHEAFLSRDETITDDDPIELTMFSREDGY